MVTLIGQIHNSQHFDLLKVTTSWEGDVKNYTCNGGNYVSHMQIKQP